MILSYFGYILKNCLSRITYNMVWTDKGPKYLLILMITALSIYMSYVVIYLQENEKTDDNKVGNFSLIIKIF